MAPQFLPLVLRTAVRQSPVMGMRSSRAFVSATSPVLERKTMKVPTMGDSITEGTIVEWTAQIGQKVKDGDVVALIETDKVTVDIKANVNGVITKQFGAVDETVEVGADLYELDTDGEATVEASVAPVIPPTTAKEGGKEPPTPKAENSKPSQPTATPQKKTQQQRMPSIQFLGKEGWSRKLAVTPELPPLPPLPINFGRPSFSAEEIEALMTGGASMAPNVKQHSYGAKFGY